MDYDSNSTARPPDRTQHVSDGIVIRCLIALAMCIAVFVAWQVALYVPQRFERDYGEGFVWSEVEYFRAGRLYPPITDYPYTIMHYTQAYYSAVAALWALGLDPLLAGRIVSLASGAALVWGCGLLASGGMPPAGTTGKSRCCAISRSSRKRTSGTKRLSWLGSPPRSINTSYAL